MKRLQITPNRFNVVRGDRRSSTGYRTTLHGSAPGLSSQTVSLSPP